MTLALENHWGLTGTAAGVRRILDGTGSPWLSVVLDTGKFNAGYRGYVSIEFEGKAHPNEGIPASVAMLRETLGLR